MTAKAKLLSEIIIISQNCTTYVPWSQTHSGYVYLINGYKYSFWLSPRAKIVSQENG